VASPGVNRQTAVVVPGVSPDVFPWDKYPVPKVLYKYFPPERFHVLTECLIRFSQRQVFEDLRELQPEVASFGNEDEIKKFMEINPALSRHPPWLREAVASHVLNTPGREAALIEQTKGWLTGPNEVGVLCLTEHLTSDEMWKEYAGDQRGFVVAFDTTHPGFNKLRSPGRLGKVEYADAPISSFLSTYGMNTFFRKRTRYEFEAEWRAIRLFTRFRPENIRRHGTGLPIYLAPFDPACITAIVMREECAVEWNLRTLAAVDARYRHVSVDLLKR
jgi:hypothetical protein